MEANSPISASPTATPSGEGASPVRIAEAPMPNSSSAIMPTSLQRSASQPAGSAPAPNSTKPATDSESSSP